MRTLRARLLLGVLVMLSPCSAEEAMIIDDRSSGGLESSIGTPWRGISDRVMGGISRESLTPAQVGGRACLRLQGEVRLENNGGFVQMALDLGRGGRTFDASTYRGLRLVVCGNGESYNAHLRSADVRLPWQAYRQTFAAPPEWTEVRLPFSGFEPYRIDAPLDTSRLRRLGLVAIGRAFHADLCVAEVAFYR